MTSRDLVMKPLQADLAAMKQMITQHREQLALARQQSLDLQRNRDRLAKGVFTQ